MKGIDPEAFLAAASARWLAVTVGPSRRALELPATPDAASEPPRKTRKRTAAVLVAPSFTPPGKWVIPVVTASEANGRDWRDTSAWTQAARRAVANALVQYLRHLAPFAEAYAGWVPLGCALTWLGSRRLDLGAVASALKAVEDAVCLLLEADDGDPRWVPAYRQEPGGPAGVRVALRAPPPEHAT